MRRLLYLLALSLVLLGPTVTRAAAGTVEGTVRPLEWAQEVEVCVAETPPGEFCVVPAPNGTYAIPGLEGKVKFEFVPTVRSRLLTQYYDHKDALAAASWIEVGQIGVVEGVDADLLEGGVIAGTVTAAAGGTPLSEVEVCAVSLSGPAVKSCGESDAGGGYELHSLPAGSYRVGFGGHGASAEYEPSSDPSVSVSAGETREIDATLAKGAQIAGVLTASVGGARLADIAVCLFAASAPGPERCTYSAEDGSYRFQGLPSGSYQVGFSLSPAELGAEAAGGEEDDFQSQYYAGVATRGAAKALALVAPATLAGVDAFLSAPPGLVPPQPAPIVTTPIVAAAPFVAEPQPRVGCKKEGRAEKR
jgi:hypothetical protein